jgi:hypothetical protein
MKNSLVFMLLISICIFANAEVYKHVDEQGKVIKYSEFPQKPGDKPMSVPKSAVVIDNPEAPPAVFTPPTKQSPDSETEQTPVTEYVAVAIVKPDDQETIRANGGTFAIELASQPELDVKAGHQYVILVDGTRHQEGTTNQLQLTDMERGQHSIQVEIQDAQGQSMISSSSVTVYVQKASALFPHPHP